MTTAPFPPNNSPFLGMVGYFTCWNKWSENKCRSLNSTCNPQNDHHRRVGCSWENFPISFFLRHNRSLLSILSFVCQSTWLVMHLLPSLSLLRWWSCTIYLPSSYISGRSDLSVVCTAIKAWTFISAQIISCESQLLLPGGRWNGGQSEMY